MKTLTARYSGKCMLTGKRIRPGDTIEWHGKGRLVLVSQDTGDNPRPANDDGRVSYEIRLSSGHTLYRNKRGICEDAPCCGCCTF
jgi:hypothetical protein